MSFTVNSLLEIATLFTGQPEDSVLNFKIKESENTDSENLDCLVHFIGMNRLKEICKRPEVDIDFYAIESGKIPLSKKEIRKIFVGVLDLRMEDYPTLLPEQRFPFNTHQELKSFFLDQVPAIEHPWFDKAQSSGKGFKGLSERVYLQSLHHLKIEKNVSSEDETFKMLLDTEMLTSRIADREMQKGTIIHLSDGYFYVDEVFIAGGAYIAALRDLDDGYRLKFVCRGTAVRRTASSGFLSGVNDMLIEIGTKGIKEIWPEISAYLKTVRADIGEVEILGKSLGGAHAQELAILVEGIAKIPVQSLKTLGSVGVSDKINQLFKEVRDQTGLPMNIHVVRIGSENEEDIDYVPSVGGVHVGIDALHTKTKVYYLNEGNKPSVSYTGSLGFFQTIRAFFSSFSFAHVHQMTLKKFSYTVIDTSTVDSGFVEQQLKMGLYFEKIRKFFAYIIHILTFGLLNGESFEDYYKSQAIVELPY